MPCNAVRQASGKLEVVIRCRSESEPPKVSAFAPPWGQRWTHVSTRCSLRPRISRAPTFSSARRNPPPRQCGIATFGSDLVQALSLVEDRPRIRWAAIDEADSFTRTARMSAGGSARATLRPTVKRPRRSVRRRSTSSASSTSSACTAPGATRSRPPRPISRGAPKAARHHAAHRAAKSVPIGPRGGPPDRPPQPRGGCDGRSWRVACSWRTTASIRTAFG